MSSSFASRRPVGDLAIFLVVFAAVWTADVVLAWRLELLPEPLRPWLRVALWLGAAVVWIAWQRIAAPLSWLGLTPVTSRQLASAVVAFAAMLGWHLVRVQVVAAPLHRLAAATPVGLAWGLVGVFAEELVFRGVVQTRLAERLSAQAAILVASVLFVLIHVPGWIMLAIPPNAPTVFLVGALCGMLRHWSGSLWPGVAAHWANNLGAML